MSLSELIASSMISAFDRRVTQPAQGDDLRDLDALTCSRTTCLRLSCSRSSGCQFRAWGTVSD